MDASIRLTAQGRGDNISYPRYQRQMERCGGTASMLKDSPLPSPSAIESKINEALKDAVKDMNALGVYTLDKNWFVFDKSLAISLSADKNDGVNDQVVDECEEEIDSDAANTEEIDEDAVDRHDMDVLRSIHDADFRQFSSWSGLKKTKSNGRSIDNTAFVQIPDSEGNIRIVKKSSIVWMLEQNVRRLSNDRQFRVRQSIPFHEQKNLVVKTVERRKIRTGDWCVFKSSSDSVRELNQKCLLGRVISLSLLSGSKKELSHQIWEWELEEKNVGVNCVWYSFNWVDNCLSGNLNEVHVFVHGFHPCESYVCSVPPPNYNCAKNLVSLSPAVLTQLEPFIRKFVQ